MCLGIDSNNFEQPFKIWGSLYHTWIRAWISFSFEVQSIVRSLCLQMDHKFSIGFKSGEFPGHFSTLMWFSFINFLTCFDVWHGAKSCWNTPDPSENNRFTSIYCWEPSYLQLGASYQYHKNWNIPKTSFFEDVLRAGQCGNCESFCFVIFEHADFCDPGQTCEFHRWKSRASSLPLSCFCIWVPICSVLSSLFL